MAVACSGWARAADDPAKELTPQERKELQSRWMEMDGAGRRYFQAGKLPEAAAAFERAIETGRRLHGKQDHADRVGTLNRLAATLQTQRNYAEAEVRFRDALAMNRRLYPMQDHADVAISLQLLVNLFRVQRKSKDAEPFYREALAMYRRSVLQAG
jgi:tetratricopeptide (TPR) repeat protein